MLLLWLSRATGVGYRDFRPMDLSKDDTKALERKTDTLVIQVEQLEREIRRHGRISPRS